MAVAEPKLILEIMRVLLIPIGLAFLTPWVVKKYQEKERDTKIRIGLVSRMSKAVMESIMAIVVANQLRDPSSAANAEKIESLITIYKMWKAEACSIGSELHAYFPELTDIGILHLKWNEFCDKLSDFYLDGLKSMYKNEMFIADDIQKSLFNEKAKLIGKVLSVKLTGFGNV